MRPIGIKCYHHMICTESLPSKGHVFRAVSAGFQLACHSIVLAVGVGVRGGAKEWFESCRLPDIILPVVGILS
jgi:hypothetical protein